VPGVGASAFCALGFAISSVIPNADASLPIVNAVILPLFFLSGIFIPLIDAPAWTMWVGRVFPISHCLSGMRAGFLGSSFAWIDVLALEGWGLGGLLLAIRFFRWEPSTD
jgi:ABC-2 type transport system permease protein